MSEEADAAATEEAAAAEPENNATPAEPQIVRTLSVSFFDDDTITYSPDSEDVNRAEVVGLLTLALKRIGG